MSNEIDRGSAEVTDNTTRFTRELYRGPIPHPSILQQFENVCPGLADRVVQMAENQSKHRIEIEKIAVNTQTKNSTRGVVFAFLIFMAGIILAGYALFVGETSFAFTSFFTTIGTAAATFIYGTSVRRKEHSENQKEITHRQSLSQPKEEVTQSKSTKKQNQRTNVSRKRK